MFNFYVLVDFKEKRILTPIDYLPKNWANINQLDLFDDEKLSNLEWAEHPNLGWIKYDNSQISDYQTSDNWLESSKSRIKLLVAAKRWEKQNEVLTFKGNRLKIDESTKSSLTLRATSIYQNQETSTVWKFVDGFVEMNNAEFLELFEFVNSYIQDCFLVEHTATQLIDSISSFSNLKELDLNLNLNWPNTEI